MGISRDSRHKRAATGAKRAHYRKKRYEVFIAVPICETGGDMLMGICTFAEHSKRVVNQPTHVLEPRESTLSALVVETINFVLSASTRVTSLGDLRELLAKPV
jgi:ribosomal protein S8E